MIKNTIYNKTFFGAANGFDGFRSGFGDIFSPRKMNKIFIIKGGPGTGKSTLMKKIRKNYENIADITTILCSSDPDSLDGIIIEKSGVKVAVVDGTSPHVVEPEFPGAVEEIVNLGDGFVFNKLRAKSKEIMTYSEEKKSAYKSAYKCLEAAGNIFKHIRYSFIKSDLYKKAESDIDISCNQNNESDFQAEKSEYLLSAFCKKGYVSINDIDTNKEVIKISGDGVSELIYMSLLLTRLTNEKISYMYFPSAFSNEIPDLIETDSIIYKIDKTYVSNIDTAKKIDYGKEYSSLKNAFLMLIETAKGYLEEASEFHFKMEDIYSESIVFDMNEDKYYRIIREIDALFDK